RAGEPFGPQDSVCGGGGAHGGFPFVVVFPIDTLTIGSFRPELLDADQVRATIAKESLAALATVPLDAGSGRLAPCPRTTCVSLASRSSKDSPTTSSCTSRSTSARCVLRRARWSIAPETRCRVCW